MSGRLLTVARRVRRARDRRWTSPRWLRRILRSGVFDREYLELQMATRFRTDAEAISAFLRADPTRAITLHPLVEGAWIERETGARVAPWYASLFGKSSLTSSGPLFSVSAPPSGRSAGSLVAALAAIGQQADDLQLSTTSREVPTVSWDRARSAMYDLARLTARQLAATARRSPAVWDAETDAAYVAAVLAASPSTSTNGPLVSVVMPTRDRAGVIERAIESVRRQSYQNWELLVIDDGSIDGTQPLLDALQKDEPRITTLRTARTGVSAARNRGLEAATGEYIAFLDTDNTWLPHFLETSVIELGRHPVSGSYSAVDVQRDDGVHEYLGSQVSRQQLLDGPNQVDLSALVVRHDVIARAGGFDESLLRWVDYDLVLRILRDGELRFLPTVGVVYDHRSSAVDRISLAQGSHWREIVLEKNLIDWDELAASTSRVAGRRSTLIRTHRQWAVTLAIVREVLSAGDDIEVVVLENGSPRDEAAILTAAFVGDPRVAVRRVPWMLTLAASTNLAFAQSTGTTITVIEPGEVSERADFSAADVLRSRGFAIDSESESRSLGLRLRGAEGISGVPSVAE